MIQFLKPWRAYNATERAGFDKETEAHLVKEGVAEYAAAEGAPAVNKQQPTAEKGAKRPAAKAEE